MYNYEVNTSSYSLPPIRQEMLLNCFLLFRKFTKKERLITETFLNFCEEELKAEWFTTFPLISYWLVQIFLRITDFHKKEKDNGENMVCRNRTALEM